MNSPQFGPKGYIPNIFGYKLEIVISCKLIKLVEVLGRTLIQRHNLIETVNFMETYLVLFFFFSTLLSAYHPYLFLASILDLSILVSLDYIVIVCCV